MCFPTFFFYAYLFPHICRKRSKNTEKYDFDHLIVCKVSVCWWKYTTLPLLNFLFYRIQFVAWSIFDKVFFVFCKSGFAKAFIRDFLSMVMLCSMSTSITCLEYSFTSWTYQFRCCFIQARFQKSLTANNLAFSKLIELPMMWVSLCSQSQYSSGTGLLFSVRAGLKTGLLLSLTDCEHQG